jgi:salicylate hydroxylase
MRLFNRNGYTGEIFPQLESVVATKRGPTRVPRTRLQAALGAQVPKGIIQFNKKLVSMHNLEYGCVRLVFQDGTETTADLVIGADGIRSVGSPCLLKICFNISQVVRQSMFPDHELRYTGMLLAVCLCLYIDQLLVSR